MSDMPVIFRERVIPEEPFYRGEMPEHVQRYRFALQFVHGKRVLDACCGVGYGSRMLARAGAAKVVGVDVCQQALQIARERYAHPAVEFVQDNCESPARISPGFDVVVALECIEHLEDPRAFLTHMARLLEAGGMFLCSTPNSATGLRQKPSNPFHVREYSQAEFRSLLEEFFCDVWVLGQGLTASTRALQAVWSNPLVRLGRLLQRARGRRIDGNMFGGVRAPTEAEFVISDVGVDGATTLLALCFRPRQNGH